MTEQESFVPEDFLDPEGEAELQDPDLAGLETRDSTLRRVWAPWRCTGGGDQFVPGKFFGKSIGQIPKPAVSAFAALEQALRSTGYSPKSSWSYNCRKISGSDKYSLHSYGIAIDIDPQLNPYSSGDPYAGLLKRKHVKAALAIKNSAGSSVWSWGGNWRKPDRMHFQLDQGPDRVDINWTTVPGGNQTYGGENVLVQGSSGEAVKLFQQKLMAWDADALSKYGADSDYGSETIVWVRKLQESYGLTATGNIDGVTASVLNAISA